MALPRNTYKTQLPPKAGRTYYIFHTCGTYTGRSGSQWGKEKKYYLLPLWIKKKNNNKFLKNRDTMSTRMFFDGKFNTFSSLFPKRFPTDNLPHDGIAEMMCSDLLLVSFRGIKWLLSYKTSRKIKVKAKCSQIINQPKHNCLAVYKINQISRGNETRGKERDMQTPYWQCSSFDKVITSATISLA